MREELEVVRDYEKKCRGKKMKKYIISITKLIIRYSLLILFASTIVYLVFDNLIIKDYITWKQTVGTFICLYFILGFLGGLERIKNEKK